MRKGFAVVELLSVVVLVVGLAMGMSLVQRRQSQSIKTEAVASTCLGWDQPTCQSIPGCAWTPTTNYYTCSGSPPCQSSSCVQNCNSSWVDTQCTSHSGCTFNETVRYCSNLSRAECESGVYSSWCSPSYTYQNCGFVNGTCQYGCSYTPAVKASCGGKSGCSVITDPNECRFLGCTWTDAKAASCTGTIKTYTGCTGGSWRESTNCAGQYCSGSYSTVTYSCTGTPLPTNTPIPPTPTPMCTPGQSYCVTNPDGSVATQYFYCNAQGSGYVLADCPAGYICPKDAASCTPAPTSTPTPTTYPGQKCESQYAGRCVGTNMVCNPSTVYTADCPSGQKCVAEAASCAAPTPTPTPACVPGSTKCFDSVSPFCADGIGTCKTDGSGYTCGYCASGQFCNFSTNKCQVLPTPTRISTPTATRTPTPTATRTPTPIPGSTISVIASGTTSQGIYPVMELRLSDVVVASWTVNSTLTAYSYKANRTVSPGEIKVAFTNDLSDATGDRNLRVDKITLDGQVFESESPATYSTGTWTSDNGCGPGYKQSEWLHCNGYFQYQTSPSPIGWWKMNETAANTCSGGVNDSCDSSGNANNGAWSGNIAPAPGKFGSGITADGNGDYVQIADSSSLDTISTTGKFTVEAWVKPNQNYGALASDWYYIVVRGGSAGWQLQLGFSGWSDSLAFSVVNSTGSYSNVAEPDNSYLTANTWYHVAGVFDGSNLHLYRNGVLKGTLAYTGGTLGPGSNVYLAGYTSSRFFNGVFDDIRIYNYARSASQIVSDMTGL